MTYPWKNEGGSAFPVDYDTNLVSFCDHGMSLLDYYIGQILVGLLARKNQIDTPAEIVSDAFAIVDAIITERHDRRHPT